MLIGFCFAFVVGIPSQHGLEIIAVAVHVISCDRLVDFGIENTRPVWFPEVEGASGFGTPAALAAPMLYSMGHPKMDSWPRTLRNSLAP